MPRPNRPGYFAKRACWRFMLAGRRLYICKGIAPDERPQRGGIPQRVWDEMDRLIREQTTASTATSDPTLYWLSEMFLDWSEAEVEAGRMPRKQSDNRRSHLTMLLELSGQGNTPARLLSMAAIDDFFVRLRTHVLPRTGGHPSGHYTHDIGRTLRSMLRWAARPVAGRTPLRLIPVDPLEGYAYPPQPSSVRGYVEGIVIRRFLRWTWARSRWAGVERPIDPATGKLAMKPEGRSSQNLKRRFDRIFVLMLRFERLTGCRPSEACGLRWEEITPTVPTTPGITWSPTTITVHPDRVKTRKQTTRERKIHLTEPVVRLLRVIERLPGRNPDYVFPHMRGTKSVDRGFVNPMAGEPWPDGSAASKKITAWRKAAIEEGLEGVEAVGPKKLIAYANRHAFASEGSSVGFSDEQIAEQMGNLPEVMRKVYAHTIDDQAALRAQELAKRRRELGRSKRPKGKPSLDA